MSEDVTLGPSGGGGSSRSGSRSGSGTGSGTGNGNGNGTQLSTRSHPGRHSVRLPPTSSSGKGYNLATPGA